DLQHALGTKALLGPQIALGDFSITYKATWNARQAAVKMILPTMRRVLVASDFVARARQLLNLDDARLIKVHHFVSNEQVNCVIMDHVDWPTLDVAMKDADGNRLTPGLVANVLANVAKAACAIHGMTGPESGASPLLVGPLRPRHIYRDEKNGRIKI